MNCTRCGEYETDFQKMEAHKCEMSLTKEELKSLREFASLPCAPGFATNSEHIFRYEAHKAINQLLEHAEDLQTRLDNAAETILFLKDKIQDFEQDVFEKNAQIKSLTEQVNLLENAHNENINDVMSKHLNIESLATSLRTRSIKALFQLKKIK